MKKIQRPLRAFLLLFCVYQLAIWVFIAYYDRLKQMQCVNAFHAPWADLFFRGLTEIAELFMPIALLLYFIWKRRSWIKPFLISYALSTALVQIGKHILFADALRPFAYFKGLGIDWYLVQGVKINEYNSFPSGHTAAAWFVFFWVSCLGGRALAIASGLLAIGVGYSRMYLFQHFPIDTAIGACIGLGSSLFVYYITFAKNDAENLS